MSVRERRRPDKRAASFSARRRATTDDIDDENDDAVDDDDNGDRDDDNKGAPPGGGKQLIPLHEYVGHWMRGWEITKGLQSATFKSLEKENSRSLGAPLATLASSTSGLVGLSSE